MHTHTHYGCLIAVGLMTWLMTAPDAWGQIAERKPSRSGAYLGVFAGGGNARRGDFQQIGIAFKDFGPFHVNAQGRSRSGRAGIAGLHAGYAWILGQDTGWQIRPALELEGLYLGNTWQGRLSNPNDLVPNHIFENSLSMDMALLVANSVWAIQTPVSDNIHPYFGGGLGMAIVSVSGADSTQLNPAEPGINHFNSSPNASSATLAAQAKTGLRAQVGQNVSIFVEYRYLRLSSTDYTFGPTVYAIHDPTTAWNVRVGTMTYHLGVAGIQYKF